MPKISTMKDENYSEKLSDEITKQGELSIRHFKGCGSLF